MNYLPEAAIWFWKSEDRQAAISAVNNRYRYQIFCDTTGQVLFHGNEDSLSDAKQAVFSLINET